jgi:hypothetical protein
LAEILTYQFWPQEDLGGAYGEEVLVEVYWDDVTEEFKVYAGGVLQVDGPTFIQSNSSNVISRPFFYSFCDGDDLYEAEKNGTYSFPYPYVRFKVTENSPVCNGNTCDLIINSIDVVTDTGSGGIITINATSSAPIFTGGTTNIIYSIGGQFLGTNTFAGIAGDITYTVTAIDSRGCRFETTVFLPKDVGYGTRYIAEIDTINGTEKIELQELNYEGESEEVCIAQSRANLNYPNQSFISFYDYVIQPSNFVLALLSDTNEKFVDLYSKSHKEWRLIYSINDVEEWRGFIVPSEFNEPYIPAPYPVEVTFTDGLALSKDIQASETNLSGRNSIIKTVATLLRTIDLDLPIHVAVDVYAGSGMNTNISSFQQTSVDSDSFENREMNVYEAIEETLRGFGCVLIQQAGAWWIVRHEQRSEPFNYYIFDLNGNLDGSDSYDGILNLSCPSDEEIVMVNRSGGREIIPAFGKVIINNEFDLKDSLLNNWNFEKDGFATTFKSWTFVKNGSEVRFDKTATPEGNSAEFSWSKLIFRNVMDAYIVSTPTFIRYKSGDKIRLKYSIAYDKMSSREPFLICKARVVLDNNLHLTQNGDEDWVTSSDDLRFYPSPQGGFTEITFEAELPEVSTITTSLLQVFIFPYWADEAEIRTDITYTELKAVDTVDLPIGYKTTISFTTGPGQGDNGIIDEYYELIEGAADVEPDDYDSVTNNKQWSKIQDAFKGAPTEGSNNTFIVDNVDVDYLPEGFEPVGAPLNAS